MASWTTITVGVADMAPAKALWIDQFGMQIIAERTGGDAALAALWEIDAQDITQQLLLATPGETVGWLHLVAFKNPDSPIRENAAVFDWVPKNLDIYVQDMSARLETLRNAGYTFRNETFSEITAPNGIRFREMQMPAHDETNVVLLEIIGQTQPMSNKHFGSVGPLIIIVPDAAREQQFFSDILRLEPLSKNLLEGPEIEKMIGLPKGAALDVSIWGAATQPLGQMEIIEYQGTSGRNLFEKVGARATGTRHVRYHMPSLAPLLERLAAHQHPFTRHPDIDLIDGSGDLLVFYSPAGLRIEVLETERSR